MTRNTTRSRSAAGRAAILILILALSSAVEARRAAATDTDAGGHLRRRDRAAGTAGTAATADARRRRRRRRRRAENAAEIVEDGGEGPTMADQVEAIMAPSSTDEGSSEAATMANMVAMQRRQDVDSYPPGVAEDEGDPTTPPTRFPSLRPSVSPVGPNSAAATAPPTRFADSLGAPFDGIGDGSAAVESIIGRRPRAPTAAVSPAGVSSSAPTLIPTDRPASSSPTLRPASSPTESPVSSPTGRPAGSTEASAGDSAVTSTKDSAETSTDPGEEEYIPREHPQPETITLAWTIRSYPPYYNARVGDTVVFLYDPSHHDVHVHPTGDCSADGAVSVVGGGDSRGGGGGEVSYTFGENEGGTTVTFACDAGGGSHCRAGQIVRFRVAGGSSVANEVDGGGTVTEVAESEEVAEVAEVAEVVESSSPSLAESGAPSPEKSDAPSLAYSGAPSLDHSSVPSLEESAAPSLAPNTDEPTGPPTATPYCTDGPFDPTSTQYSAGDRVTVHGFVYECRPPPYEYYCNVDLLEDVDPEIVERDGGQEVAEELYAEAWEEVSRCIVTEAPSGGPTTAGPTG